MRRWSEAHRLVKAMKETAKEFYQSSSPCMVFVASAAAAAMSGGEMQSAVAWPMSVMSWASLAWMKSRCVSCSVWHSWHWNQCPA